MAHEVNWTYYFAKENIQEVLKKNTFSATIGNTTGCCAKKNYHCNFVERFL